MRLKPQQQQNKTSKIKVYVEISGIEPDTSRRIVTRSTTELNPQFVIIYYLRLYNTKKK